jgi:hypothetical protein
MRAQTALACVWRDEEDAGEATVAVGMASL